MYEHVNTVDKT